MSNKDIDLEQLKKLHSAGGIAYARPSSFDVFDIPEDLLTSWKDFIESKDKYDEMLKKYKVI